MGRFCIHLEGEIDLSKNGLLENDFNDNGFPKRARYPSSCVFSLGQGHMLNFHKNSKSAEKNFKDKKQCELSESR